LFAVTKHHARVDELFDVLQRDLADELTDWRSFIIPA
jgi:hypothetical protein